MKKVPENIMMVTNAVIPLVVVLVLFVILGQIGLSKINDIRDQIATAKTDQSVYTQKLDLLKNVSITGIHDSNVAINSFPDSNPALMVVNQLKNLAVINNLVLSSIKTTGTVGTATDINSVDISFTAVGNKDSLETFLASIDSFAPVSTLDSVKITQSGNTFSGNIKVKSYWALLPTKLPDSISGFTELSDADKKVLATISKLTQPVFIELPQASISGRTDPFSAK